VVSKELGSISTHFTKKKGEGAINQLFLSKLRTYQFMHKGQEISPRTHTDANHIKCNAIGNTGNTQLQCEAGSGHACLFETGYNWDHKLGERQLFSLALRSVTPTDTTIK